VDPLGAGAVFLTFSNGAVGNARERTASSGNLGAKKPDKITLSGSGRDSPEPPSVGSTPGHPKKIRLILRAFLTG
jgi:hypothetical protein